MPSVTHEALVELFRNRPTLAAEMLQDALGQPVPAFTEARVVSSDLAEIVPSDRRADVVVVYGDLVLSSLNEAARRRLEAIMKAGYQFQSEFARSYVAKGKIEAKAQAVLAFLEARGLEIPPEVRERVLASTDLDELDRWIRCAAVVSDARELLATSAS